jgi:two-component SAPR family response regulator
MIKAIAVDDEPPALEILENYCRRTEKVELMKVFTSTSRALEYLEQFSADLIFLDINMPSISGLEFAKRIPQQSMVIFTTSYTEYAVESYSLNAVDYLLKPYTFARFQQAIEKAEAVQRL